MNISVLTPDKKIFVGKINSVTVPGTLGRFQVLNNHAPIVSSLTRGKIELVTSDGDYQYYDVNTGKNGDEFMVNKTLEYQITGGFIEVLNNEISLLVKGI